MNSATNLPDPTVFYSLGIPLSKQPARNPFYNIYWLAKGYEEHRILEHSPVTYLKALVPIQLP
jgi:hypothetical protein